MLRIILKFHEFDDPDFLRLYRIFARIISCLTLLLSMCVFPPFRLSRSRSEPLACEVRGMRVAAFIGNTNFLLAVYLTADLFVARASPAAGNGEEDRVNDVKHKTLRGPGQST